MGTAGASRRRRDREGGGLIVGQRQYGLLLALAVGSGLGVGAASVATAAEARAEAPQWVAGLSLEPGASTGERSGESLRGPSEFGSSDGVSSLSFLAESENTWPSTCPDPDGPSWEPEPVPWDSPPLEPSQCSRDLGTWTPEVARELAAIRVTVAYGLGLLLLLTGIRAFTAWRTSR